MTRKEIVHARESVKIYQAQYKPTINPLKFLKGFLAVIIHGSAPVAHSYTTSKRKKW